jgi:hypothetical protein
MKYRRQIKNQKIHIPIQKYLDFHTYTKNVILNGRLPLKMPNEQSQEIVLKDMDTNKIIHPLTSKMMYIFDYFDCF